MPGGETEPLIGSRKDAPAVCWTPWSVLVLPSAILLGGLLLSTRLSHPSVPPGVPGYGDGGAARGGRSDPPPAGERGGGRGEPSVSLPSSSSPPAAPEASLLSHGRLPLSTEDSRIVDRHGSTVRLACVNWYGAHMGRHVANGLDMRRVDDLARLIAEQGFNCVRLPYSLEMWYLNPVVSDGAVSANPQLRKMTALGVFDATVKALTGARVAVILNNHNSGAGWCCSDTDGSGLWFNVWGKDADRDAAARHREGLYTAAEWQDAVVAMSERYARNRFVIGNDLRNEIRRLVYEEEVWGPTWTQAGAGWYRKLVWGPKKQNRTLKPVWHEGSNLLERSALRRGRTMQLPKVDWKAVATQCGNAVHKVAPNQLIIVEGLNYATNLHPFLASPIELVARNKLVLSFHLYSWSRWWADPPDWVFYSVQDNATPSYPAWRWRLDGQVGKLLQRGNKFTVPLFLGEFGTNSRTAYWKNTVQWLRDNPSVAHAYWAWNGYKHGSNDTETYGIMCANHTAVQHPWLLEDLRSIQRPAAAR